MRCPFCTGTLGPFKAAPDLVVEVCDGCRCLRLDPGELNRLIGGDVAFAVTQDFPAFGVVLPSCTRCGKSALRENLISESRERAYLDCLSCSAIWLGKAEAVRLRKIVAEARLLAFRRRHSQKVRSERDETPLAWGLLQLRGLFELAQKTVLRPVLDWLFRDLARFYLLSVIVFSFAFSLTIPGAFLGSLVGMPFHELGHALASWLSGRFAIPLPFFTLWSEEQSVFLGLGLTVAFAFLAAQSFRARRWVLLLVSGGGCLSVLLLWLVCSKETSRMIQILSGCLGESWLGALLLGLFFASFPKALRWDFWRFPLAFPASFSFCHALVFWSGVRRDLSLMPWGSALGDESDGDLFRLVHEYDWSAQELADFYYHAALLGSLFLLSVVMIHSYRAKLPLFGKEEGISDEPAFRA